RCQTDYPVCRIRQRIAAFGSKSKSVTERCIDRSTFRPSGAFQSTPAGYGYTDQSIHPAEPQKAIFLASPLSPLRGRPTNGSDPGSLRDQDLTLFVMANA
ncbi:MAG: hypothetical protein KDI47_17910, partial [Gammaproteobacteria bacterium]|nr:hypothetical protein [Gammaproteobacteria bacterium]